MYEVTLQGEQQAKPRRIDADTVVVDPHWVKFTMSQPPAEPLIPAVEIGGEVYEKIGIRPVRRSASPTVVAIFPASRIASICRVEE